MTCVCTDTEASRVRTGRGRTHARVGTRFLGTRLGIAHGILVNGIKLLYFENICKTTTCMYVYR